MMKHTLKTRGLVACIAASSLALTHAASGQTAVTLDGTSGSSTNASNYSTTGGLDLGLGFFVDYLVVGAGGGAGSGVVNNAYPAGGGGGGVFNGSAYQIQPQSYALTIGAGGAGGGNGNGGNGGSSSLFGVTAGGGIGPLTSNSGVGGASASGNAGGLAGTNRPGGEPGGGGGGDAGPGGNGTYNPGTGVGAGGTGGIGTFSSITGTSVMYGFGGGGGSVGAAFQNGDGTTGHGPRVNSGGGGAGAGTGAGPGAAGTVIVRYQGSAASTGGTITSGTGTSTGYTVQTFTGTGSSALDFSGVNLNTRLGATATGVISGSGDVTYHGPGSLSLTGTNTYTGATTVAAGRLFIDGDQSAATGSVTVNSGALLGGADVVGGNTTIQAGATLAPGDNAPGSLTFNGDLTLAGSSTLSLQIGGTSPGSTYSRGLIGGQLTLAGTLSVNAVNGFNLAVGQTFYVLDNSSNNAVNGTFSNTTNNGMTYTDALGNVFHVNYADSAGDGTDGNDVSLTVLSLGVPEPSTTTAMVAGLAGLIGVVFRRRSRAV